MIAIIWVVIIVAVAIWQLSIAPGRTQLQGKPFELEKAPVPKEVAPKKPKSPPVIDSEPIPEVLAVEPEMAGIEAIEAGGLSSIDLMNAIVLSEVLAPPRSKQVRRQQR